MECLCHSCHTNVRFRCEQQQLALKCRYEREQSGQLVRFCIENDYGDRERAQVLLVRKVLVNGDESVEVVPREGE